MYYCGFGVISESLSTICELFKGIRFIVLYPPKCSHDLPSLAGRDIPEQPAAYSQGLSQDFKNMPLQNSNFYTSAKS